MTEDDKRELISFGMMAVYADILDKITTKIGIMEKGKLLHPEYADYYDSVIELYSEEFDYCKTMLQVGRDMSETTLQ